MRRIVANHVLGLRPAMALIGGALLAALALPCAGADSAQDSPVGQLQQKTDPRPSSLVPLVPPVQTPTVLPAPGAEEAFRARMKWREALRSNPKPKKGCFNATFPDTVWHEVPCKTVPPVPYHGNHSGSFVVGGGGVGDFSALEPSSFISSAQGSFERVNDGITEAGQNYGAGPQVNNAYSLQLNTNYFATPLCSGAKSGAPCLGWEQFVFANDGDSGHALIQYWLLSYDNPCPPHWNQPPADASGEIDCFINNESGATPIPAQPVSTLASVSVIGAASDSSDSMIVLVDTTAYLVAGDNLLAVAAGWNAAEFNVFGNGGGGQANFGPNSSMVVRTFVNDGGEPIPSCELASFTGETNNLTLSGTPPVATSASPSIAFTQTNTGAAPAGCVTATGDRVSQQMVSGENYVDFGSDKTGLGYYTVNGAMCVVHSPSCPGNAFTGIFGVGHNGKDHFFPADASLPAGVVVEGVAYTVFWPPGIDHTDRGGLGSKGSYGANADPALQAKSPLYSVEWQNACQPSTGADWSAQNLTYQVSFIISVPNGVAVKGAVPLGSPVGDICREGDRPAGNGNGSPSPTVSTFVANLHSSAPANGGFLPWAVVFPPVGLATTTPISAWTIQSITNVNDFDVFLVGQGSNSDQCFQKDHGQLLKKGSALTNIAALYGTNHPFLSLVVCTEGSVPAAVALSIQYLH